MPYKCVECGKEYPKDNTKRTVAIHLKKAHDIGSGENAEYIAELEEGEEVSKDTEHRTSKAKESKDQDFSMGYIPTFSDMEVSDGEEDDFLEEGEEPEGFRLTSLVSEVVRGVEDVANDLLDKHVLHLSDRALEELERAIEIKVGDRGAVQSPVTAIIVILAVGWGLPLIVNYKVILKKVEAWKKKRDKKKDGKDQVEVKVEGSVDGSRSEA